jgi:hypothetical protein
MRAASVAAVLLTLAQPAYAATQAGVAAVVVGDVTISDGDRAQPTAAETGMRMDLGDRVSSAERARMQILLLDQTVFTVGPNSDLVIDKFVYDPAAGTGQVAASYSRGVFRYVSGQVAKINPQNVSIRTPMGTIGVRGTALFVTDDPQTGKTFIGLSGPGAQNNADMGSGGFTFRPPTGDPVDVSRADTGIFVAPGEPPSAPVPTPARLVQLLTSRLTAAAPQAAARASAASSGGGTQASGQQTAETRATGAAIGGALNANQGLSLLATQATEEGAARTSEEVGQLAQMGSETPLNNFAGRLPFGVAIPYGVQMSWTTISDLDLHLTGPNAGGAGRFHVYFGDTGNYSSAPFAALDSDRVGIGGSEVIGISQFNSGGPYRASVFNFGDQNSASTSLSSQSNLVVSFIRNGLISRGPNGSALVNGTIVRSVSPTAGQAGNTFVAFEIDPLTQSVTPIAQITNSAGSGSVQ